MHKHFDFGYPCHIPSTCKHKVFRKDTLVIYLVDDKPPKDANGYWFPDGFDMLNILDLTSRLSCTGTSRFRPGQGGPGGWETLSQYCPATVARRPRAPDSDPDCCFQYRNMPVLDSELEVVNRRPATGGDGTRPCRHWQCHGASLAARRAGPGDRHGASDS